MRVIGLDPGLRRTGWGVIDADGAVLAHVANGCCRSVGSSLGERLASLFEQLTEIVATYAPEEASVEKTFVNSNYGGSLTLGHARGVAILSVARMGIRIGEYAPNAVKKAVTGVGHADKIQVEAMIQLQLPGALINGTDAADALAVAVAHTAVRQFSNRLNDALFRAAHSSDVPA
ncbi:MAG: crossover junction endodeoxyribonuclease RuvC [Rhodobacteraceae bacterium]|nr:crossover junction endodeoxyribonuclease RuvC [Paracoccaceae bacterium]MCY4196565.1 crossover junction endodeoxyribonuclease RuvC [Paracoccaceae bacterium]